MTQRCRPLLAAERARLDQVEAGLEPQRARTNGIITWRFGVSSRTRRATRAPGRTARAPSRSGSSPGSRSSGSLDRLELLTSLELAELVAAEVDGPVDDGRGATRFVMRNNEADIFSRNSAWSPRASSARVHTAQGVGDHELARSRPTPSTGRAAVSSARSAMARFTYNRVASGSGRRRQAPGSPTAVTAGAAMPRLDPLVDGAAGPVDGHELPSRNVLGRTAGADDARHAELSAHDGGVAREAPPSAPARRPGASSAPSRAWSSGPRAPHPARGAALDRVHDARAPRRCRAPPRPRGATARARRSARGGTRRFGAERRDRARLTSHRPSSA